MLTLDTCFEPTAAGRAYVRAAAQHPNRRPMLRCSICGRPIREAFDDETGIEEVICPGCDREIDSVETDDGGYPLDYDREEEPNPYAGTYSEN